MSKRYQYLRRNSSSEKLWPDKIQEDGKDVLQDAKNGRRTVEQIAKDYKCPAWAVLAFLKHHRVRPRQPKEAEAR